MPKTLIALLHQAAFEIECQGLWPEIIIRGFYSSVTALRLCHLLYKQRRTWVLVFHLKLKIQGRIWVFSAPHDKRKACANELKPSLLEFLQRVQPRLAESNWIATCCKTEEFESFAMLLPCCCLVGQTHRSAPTFSSYLSSAVIECLWLLLCKLHQEFKTSRWSYEHILINPKFQASRNFSSVDEWCHYHHCE